MRQLIFGIAALLLVSTSMSARSQEMQSEVFGSGSQPFSLATGSPGELGLLKLLAETFAAKQRRPDDLAQGRHRPVDEAA